MANGILNQFSASFVSLPFENLKFEIQWKASSFLISHSNVDKFIYCSVEKAFSKENKEIA